jgi:hypothetical protein
MLREAWRDRASSIGVLVPSSNWGEEAVPELVKGPAVHLLL